MPDYGSPFEQARLATLHRLIPAGTGKAVDIGCHNGMVGDLVAAAGYEVIGYDLDGQVIAKAKELRPSREFRVGTAADAAAAFPDRSLTVCAEVIEHIDTRRQQEFLDDIARGSPCGAQLVLSTPMRHSIVATYERLRYRQFRDYDWWDPTHVAVIGWPRLKRMLSLAGFHVDSRTGFHFFSRGAPGSHEGRLARLGFILIVVARRTLQLRDG